MTNSSDNLTFSPTSLSLLNSNSSGMVILTDSAGASTTYHFTVSVPNREPYFTDNRTSFDPVLISLNSVYNVTIPSFLDPDLTTPNITFTQITSSLVTSNLIGITIL